MLGKRVALRRPPSPRRALPGRWGCEPLESRVLLSAAQTTEVVGRHVFYNNSAYDGYSMSADAADDGAIATDKVALLPGERASFANYTSYSLGINGVMVDIAGLQEGGAGAIGADDFEWWMGNGVRASAWLPAPAPEAVTVRQPDGPNGLTRVTLTWPDRAIRNRWLQVTVKANADTGLASPDLFFFGNLMGETGDSPAVARVSAKDRLSIRSALANSFTMDGRFDFDRSGVVDTADLLVLRRNLARRLYLPQALAGAGMGLAATYFDDPEFAGTSVQRIDREIDFDWRAGSPAPDIEPSTYSVRWTGQVRPAHSEEYAFHVTSNDGVRLWVDGRLIIDNWSSHAVTEDVGRIALEAGRKYDIRVDYFQHLGTATMKLEWSSPTLAREVVPTTRLYPATPPAVDPTPGDSGADPIPPPVGGDWRMVFRDEFDGAALGDVWHTAQYWDSDHTVVGGAELQAYDATGVSLSDGLLHLTARPDNAYGVPYVSGLVQTGGDDNVPAKPTFNFRYGYLEVRAKMPAGQGLWPAIWMMPASHDDDNGELDVLEMIGSDPTTAHFALHRNGTGTADEWLGANLSRTFHTFGVDWQPDHVSWYVDGIERARVTDPALICPEAMYPILNVAVGGDWAGVPDATTQFPASMDVDFVRVWQRPPATA